MRPKKEYKYSDETTVRSIFNVLTIVMISCVLLPVLIANVYNLWFTNPGRQLFWEDIESISITGFLLALMLYDTFKKTKKIELEKLKRPEAEQLEVSKTALAGIPVDLANQKDDDQSLQNFFKSAQEIRRFRDILSAMLKGPNSVNRLKPMSGEADNMDSEGNIVDVDDQSQGNGGNGDSNVAAQFRRRLKGRRNLDAAMQGRSMKIDKAGTDNSGGDITALTVRTEDGLMGTDRNLISLRNQASDRGIFKDQQPYRSPINELVAEDDGMNFNGRNRNRQSTDANVLSTTPNENASDKSPNDRNRENIHGGVDDLTLQNLGLVGAGDENLQESGKKGGRAEAYNEALKTH